MSAEQFHRAEYWADSITHGLGAVASIVGLAVMVAYATELKDGAAMAAVVVFCAALILLYTASTMYHSAIDHVAKSKLQIFDHAAIFVLIAGTYTPIAVISLSEGMGLTVLILIWSLAVVGIIFKLFLTGKYEKISLAIYLLMGWLCVFFGKSLLGQLHEDAVWLLAAGGLSYTLGVIFYSWEKLPFHHAIWHLFVMAGSVFHYLAILLYIVLEPAAQS